MSFDFKKEYRNLYMPPAKPALIDVPAIRYASVEGKGDPNTSDEYRMAISLLYALSYTIKMEGRKTIDGYFEYVVPPLEGLWWTENGSVKDSAKDSFRWISIMRLPDFVIEDVFEMARETAGRKKGSDFSPVRFLEYREGLCVQCMHHGSFDEEKGTIDSMVAFIEGSYALDFTERFHHEIYLSDPRRVTADRMKTVIRLPIKPIEQ